jgi:biotin operon repressor
VADEVEDLAHDLIVSALRRGLPLEGETFLRSASGAARRQAAFVARSAGRRRAREAQSTVGEVLSGDEGTGADDLAAASLRGAALSVLSPALRTTLLLLAQGLDKAELRLALGLSDAALRKRFQALRDHGPLARPELHLLPRSPALSELRRTQVATLPRLGDAAGARARWGRLLGAGDPDGHGLIFAEVLTPEAGSAT